MERLNNKFEKASCLVHLGFSFYVCLSDSHTEFPRWTPVFVKLLLPLRQSLRISRMYRIKGTYVFEYELFATQEGEFSNGITTLQCMYAPEFATHSEGIRVKVAP